MLDMTESQNKVKSNKMVECICFVKAVDLERALYYNCKRHVFDMLLIMM